MSVAGAIVQQVYWRTIFDRREIIQKDDMQQIV